VWAWTWALEGGFDLLLLSKAMDMLGFFLCCTFEYEANIVCGH